MTDNHSHADGSDRSAPRGARVVVLSGSTRTGSLNTALAHAIGRRLEASGESVAVVDLVEYPMPMYHGDDEAATGVPPAAWELARLLADASVLIIVSPEYNGAFTPLLKNSIDWVTRAQRGVFANLRVFLAAASPGGRGGVGGLALLRHWMENMRLDVGETTLSVASASLDDDGRIVGVDSEALDEFVDQVSTAVPA